jgi:hypothetical protein
VSRRWPRPYKLTDEWKKRGALAQSEYAIQGLQSWVNEHCIILGSK